MIWCDCDKDLSTTRVSFPCILCTLGGVALVGSILVLNIMIDLGWGSNIVALGHLCHSYGNNKSRVDSRLTGHLGWDLSTADCTNTLSLSDPFLKTLEAEVVPTWRRDRPLRELHTKRAIHTLIQQIQNPICPSPTLTTSHIINCSRPTAQNLLPFSCLLLIRQRLIHLNCPNCRHKVRSHRFCRHRFRIGAGDEGAVGALPVGSES